MERREIPVEAGVFVGDALRGDGVEGAVGARFIPSDARAAGDTVEAGRLLDLVTKVPAAGRLVPFFYDDDEALYLLRHSAAHVMAQAIREEMPETRFAIGPVIEDGFFYDVEPPKPITDDDLPRLEARMREIIAAAHPFRREVVSREKALADFGHDRFKKEIIDQLPPDAEISFYTQDTFTDLCRGPHLPDTSMIGAVKLLKVAGAYWRGREGNPVLTRIYGTAWRTQEELDAHLERIEEAKKRDHRALGKALDLFSVSDEVGGGLVLWHPKGARVRRIVEEYWRRAHDAGGYVQVYTPHVGRKELWARSGHLEYYKENMYPEMELEGQSFYLKPMNCPFHIQIYKSRTRSYRDLPIRMAEMGTVYRFERSGVLHGLLRVRGFTQDDAHIFSTREGVEAEVREVIRFSRKVLADFGFEDLEVFLATRPFEKSVGSDEEWKTAESALAAALSAEGVAYKTDEGGGAFYGPKIDVAIRDALGRRWQTATIQFDFNLPERFDLEYVAEDGKGRRPFMIHRALLGSFERFFGCLIEHYAGRFPLWLAPVQVRVLPVSDKVRPYAEGVCARLEGIGLRAEVDLRNEKVGKKIRDAEVEKIPVVLVVGPREAEAEAVAVRRGGRDEGAKPLSEVARELAEAARPPG